MDTYDPCPTWSLPPVTSSLPRPFPSPRRLAKISPVLSITLLSFLPLLHAHERTHVPDGFCCSFPSASPSSFPPCSDFRPKYESSVRPGTARGARPVDPLRLGGCFIPTCREGGKGGRAYLVNSRHTRTSVDLGSHVLHHVHDRPQREDRGGRRRGEGILLLVVVFAGLSAQG